MKLTQPEIARHYSKMNIETASHQKRITMLHEKCVEYITITFKKTVPEKRLWLNKAQNILAQLEASLKLKDRVSQGLFYLYDYTYALLDTCDDNDSRKASEIMSGLRDTFRILLKRM